MFACSLSDKGATLERSALFDRIQVVHYHGPLDNDARRAAEVCISIWNCGESVKAILERLAGRVPIYNWRRTLTT